MLIQLTQNYFDIKSNLCFSLKQSKSRKIKEAKKRCKWKIHILNYQKPLSVTGNSER